MARRLGMALVGAILIASGSPLRAADPPRPAGPKLTERQQAQWDAARAVLEKADSLELYSLDPEYLPPDKRPKDGFHGWKVLGKTAVKDADARKKVVAVASAAGSGVGAKCFEPRHGIRAKAGDQSVDLVICFACSWVYVYTGPGEDDLSVRLPIGREQRPDLDAVLKEAKVPLPEARKD